MAGIKNVWGAATVRTDTAFGSPESLLEVYDLLEQYNCHIIDTATLYGPSEELLGKSGAGKRFTLDTKAPCGFPPGGGKKETILENFQNSKKQLGVDQVDVYYLHAPDRTTPIEETLEGVNEAYKAGWFKRFGLSNFFADEVQKVYDVCKEKGYPLPSVYQGNYNAVSRKQEEVLFPTLRKLGIAFYAYSPLAGGFLTKTKQDIVDGKGRFDPSNMIGKMYSNLYSKPSLLEALAKWTAIAQDEGTTNADLAYRWVKYNSPLKPEYGDAIIFGSSNAQQLKQTLAAVEAGSLSEKAVKAIDEIWEGIKHEAPLDNVNG